MNEVFILEILKEFEIIVYNKSNTCYQINYHINHETVRKLVFFDSHVVFGLLVNNNCHTISFPLLEEYTDEVYELTKEIIHDLLTNSSQFPSNHFQVKQERKDLIDCFLKDIGMEPLQKADWYPHMYFSKNENLDIFCSRSGIEIVFNRDKFKKRIDLSIPVEYSNLNTYAKLLIKTLDYYNLV